MSRYQQTVVADILTKRFLHERRKFKILVVFPCRPVIRYTYTANRASTSLSPNCHWFIIGFCLSLVSEIVLIITRFILT